MTWACISRLSKNSSKNLNLNFTLMYTDLQIDCIRAFGDKELKGGCKIIEDNKYVYSFCYRTLDTDVYRFILYSHSGHTNKLWRFTDWNVQVEASFWKITEILWSEPNLFPDVAKKLREKGYNLEVLQWDTLTSIIRISRWDIKKPQIIEYKPCLPLLEQPKAMESLLALIK